MLKKAAFFAAHYGTEINNGFNAEKGKLWKNKAKVFKKKAKSRAAISSKGL